MTSKDFRLRRVLGLCCAGLLLSLQYLRAQQTRPIDPANMDTTCKACDDFFGFADGGWIRRAAIPADLPRWGSFNELQESNYAALKSTLEDAQRHLAGAADPNTKKLGLFYQTCMDSTQAERNGVRPLAAELGRIRGIRSRGDLEPVLARLQQIGLNVPFSFHSVQDAKQSTRVIGEFSQAGLGLPDRDYYTKTDSGSAAIRAQYAEYMARLFRLAGDDSLTVAGEVATVMGIETALAIASMTRVERRDPEAVYHLMGQEQLRNTAPDFRWTRFFAALGLRDPGDMNVAQPRFVAAVDSLVARLPVEDWKTYLRWHVLSGSAATLSSPFVNADFQFRQGVLQGVKEMRPRWKRCLQYADQQLGEVLGQAYVKTHFTPEAKARALQMVRNIQAEFHLRLAGLSWMSDATKAKAAAKLDAIVNKIGYPDHWRDYAALDVKPGPFILNLQRAAIFRSGRDLSKIGRPLDKSDWTMSPPTVNASYSPQRNDVTIPAGIMQPPFFDPAADDAVNYGGMGAAIGHEITHGFDDQGRQFDADGNLSGWWSEEDAASFKRRAEVVVDQFNGYVAVDTIKLNGRLTLGENIADFGGLTLAYAAYRRTLEGRPEPPPIDGFTGDQRFFLAWAQIWRQVARPEFARLLVATDPHSPGRWRTNGPLSNMPEFRKAFGCMPGDPMVRPDSLRAEIW